MLRHVGDDFMAEQRHVGQLVAGFQALVEFEHGVQIPRLGTDTHLTFTSVRGQGQQGDVFARHGFEHGEQALPRTAQLLGNLAHFGQVMRLLAGFGRGQCDLAAGVAGECSLGVLQMALLLRGLFVEVVLGDQTHQRQYHATAQQAPAQWAGTTTRLEVEHQRAHVRPPSET